MIYIHFTVKILSYDYVKQNVTIKYGLSNWPT